MESRRAATLAALGAVGIVTAAAVARRRGERPAADLHRWRVVTVDRTDLDQHDRPAPLAALGDGIEVQMSAAPGDKGTELRARWREGARLPQDDDPLAALRVALRVALRESRQHLEVGWVLEPDANTTTAATALNAPLRRAVSRARGVGLL